MSTVLKSSFARMLLVLAGLLWTAAACAQSAWPSRPIKLVSPYAPGGSVTLIAHLVGEKLQQRLGQPVVIDNRPGASTSIGTEYVVRAQPDGYTLLLGAATLVLFPHMLPTPYDVTRDLIAVGAIGAGDLILAVHPSVPARNLPELVALAKARPGQLAYSTSGAGGLTHLAMEQLSAATGTKFNHIPYKGAGPATTDLLGGQVQLAFQTPAAVLQHIKNGKLRAIAYTGSARLAELPDVPTFAEAGIPNFEPRTWYGVFAPAGTPRPIVDRLASELAAIAMLPDVKEKLAREAIEPLVAGPEKFGAMVRGDYERYGKLIRDANIHLTN